MENGVLPCKKKAKLDDKIRMLKSAKWRSPTKVPVCVVEDHCEVCSVSSVLQYVPSNGHNPLPLGCYG